MAGELQHAPALPNSAQLTQSEYEAVEGHTLNNGVAEDIIKWDGTKFVRVPKGADGTYLGYAGGVLGASSPGLYTPAVRIVTVSPDTVSITDDILLVDTTLGPITLVLPSLAAATKVIRIKRTSDDANDVTIDPWSTELIEEEANFVLPGGSLSAVVIVPSLDLGSWWVT